MQTNLVPCLNLKLIIIVELHAWFRFVPDIMCEFWKFAIFFLDVFHYHQFYFLLFYKFGSPSFLLLCYCLRAWSVSGLGVHNENFCNSTSPYCLLILCWQSLAIGSGQIMNLAPILPNLNSFHFLWCTSTIFVHFFLSSSHL